MHLIATLIFITQIILATTAHNVSLTDLLTCKEYRIKSDYLYRDFFELTNLENTKRDKDDLLRLKFYVIAAKDAHIMLSTSDKPGKTDRVYEIVIGAGMNTFSVLRDKVKSGRLVTRNKGQFLSAIDPTPIEIQQSIGGQFVVNLTGMDEPHLTYTDPNPLLITHVSFSSYGTTPAKWYYDCKFDGFDKEMELETRFLSPSERVEHAIFENYTDTRPPRNLKNVTFGFHVKSVTYQEQTEVMSSRLMMDVQWSDDRLQWNSSEYENIKFITEPIYRFWTPTIKIVNGAMETFKNFAPTFISAIHSNGTVNLRTMNAEIDSWCFEATKNWPSDDVECEIEFKLDDANIQLTHDGSSPLNSKLFSQFSEWNLASVLITKSNDSKAKESIDTDTVSNMVLKFKLRRNSAFYKRVFYTPAWAAQITILLSFFLEGYKRGGLNLLSILLICIAFMFVSRHTPIAYVPDIVKIYEKLLGVATCTYLLHILTIWLVSFPPKDKPHPWILAFMNFSPLRFVLGIQFVDSASYLKIQEYPWQDLARILNRIVFIATAVMFVILSL